jgi:hypothetical protein
MSFTRPVSVTTGSTDEFAQTASYTCQHAVEGQNIPENWFNFSTKTVKIKSSARLYAENMEL